MASVVLSIAVIVVCLAVMAVAVASIFFTYKGVFSFKVGLYLSLLAFGLELVFGELPALPLPILLYPQDFIFMAVFSFFCMSCIMGYVKLEGPLAIWFAVFIIEIVLFIWGLLVFGKYSGVEFRSSFYLAASVFYFSSYNYSEKDLAYIAKVLSFTVWLVALVVAIRLFSDVVLGTQYGLTIGAKPLRVINAHQTLFVLLVWLYLVTNYEQVVRNNGLVVKCCVYVAPLLVFLLQHRTVWVAALIPAIFMGFQKNIFKQWLKNPILCVLVIPSATFIFLYAILSNEVLMASLEASVTEAFQPKRSTFTWRLSSWLELLNSWWSGSLLVNALGFPFGAGWRRYIADLGQFNENSPHSFYVQTILRGGLVKLSLVFAFWWLLISSGLKKYKDSHKNRADIYLLPVFTVLATALFLFTYGSAPFIGLFWGLSCAQFVSHRTRIDSYKRDLV